MLYASFTNTYNYLIYNALVNLSEIKKRVDIKQTESEEMWVCFLPDQKKVNFSVISSASIYLTIQDRHETNFPVMFLKKQGEG